jgi:hypothetical protein
MKAQFLSKDIPHLIYVVELALGGGFFFIRIDQFFLVGYHSVIGAYNAESSVISAVIALSIA